MDTALLKALYGTDDEKDILRGKTTEKQVRAVANGKSGSAVQMTPEECAKMCKALNGVEYLTGYEHRVLQYRITDESVDRYGDIVRAKGVRLDNYKKNPVVQFAHNYEEPPVGVSLKTWFDKETNSVMAWPMFIDDRHDTTGRSELVYRLAKANIMRACSIGFVPIDVYNPGNTEERTKIGLGDYGVEFKKCDLMEFSPVAVPANPSALQDGYQESFVRGLRDVGFERRHLDTLRKYPVIGDNAIDSLIQGLDAKRVAIVVNESGDTETVNDVTKTSAANPVTVNDGVYISAEGEIETVENSAPEQTTTPGDTDNRATNVTVSLDCGSLSESIAQLMAALAEAKQQREDELKELREMVSLVRDALADNRQAQPKSATNTKLYDLGNALKLKH